MSPGATLIAKEAVEWRFLTELIGSNTDIFLWRGMGRINIGENTDYIFIIKVLVMTGKQRFLTFMRPSLWELML